MRLIYREPYQDRKSYIQESLQVNQRGILVLAFFALVVQISVFVLSTLNPFSDNETVMLHYTRFYVVFIGLNIICILLSIHVRKKYMFTGHRQTLVVIFRLFVLYFWAMGVAVADQMQGDDVVVYQTSKTVVVGRACIIMLIISH